MYECSEYEKALLAQQFVIEKPHHLMSQGGWELWRDLRFCFLVDLKLYQNCI